MKPHCGLWNDAKGCKPMYIMCDKNEDYQIWYRYPGFGIVFGNKFEVSCK